MALLHLRNLTLSLGGPKLFNQANLQLFANERVALIGRNGEGKSTLMKVILGEIQPDSGERIVKNGVQISYLQQDVPNYPNLNVFDIVSQGFDSNGQLLANYFKAGMELENNPDDGKTLEKYNDLYQQMEQQHAWHDNQLIEQTLSKMGLEANILFNHLSGGMKRRVLLAKAIVSQPDILLLDEPTNHLDIEAIIWLENFLKNFRGTLFFITHDRNFLQNLATRIVDLDRGQLNSWQCDYQTYLQRKADALAAEEKENKAFDKKLAQEEVWIRQGIKARRTRNEGRVRALKALRKERAQRRTLAGSSKIQLNKVELSGKKVIEVKHLYYAWDNKPIIKDFSTLILRGDKIGIIGPNGCGKTTLIQLLLGQIKPDHGTVELGTNLQIAFFDQHRGQLKMDKTVADNVADGHDYVEINGNKKHIMSYLADFLFTSDRARQPVCNLSGGEKNRLLLARILAKPANLLVLDEPTNDLDMETLELLEEKCIEYPGTLLIVSHDRAFINNIATSVFVFEGNGKVNEYIGGYDDWLAQRPQTQESKTVNKTKKVTETKQKPKKKLSYKAQREYDQLPESIEQLELQSETLQQQMSQPDFYQQPPDKIKQAQQQYEQTQKQLEQAYTRWEELEQLIE